MNAPFSSPEQLALLDRLVDGELSSDERRALLRRLEEEPEGWRRCALAFLEAQALRESLGSLASELRSPRAAGRAAAMAAAPSEAAPIEIASRPQRLAAASPRRFDMLGMFLAAAASFLIAFFLGVNSGSFTGRAPVAAPPGATQLAHSSTAPGAPLQATPVEWNTLPLVVNSNGQSHEMHVPVATGPQADVTLLEEQPQRLPDAVERRLRRQGYEVNYDRELVDMPLEDGRKAVLPVDNVRVQFVGDKRIQ